MIINCVVYRYGPPAGEWICGIVPLDSLVDVWSFSIFIVQVQSSSNGCISKRSKALEHIMYLIAVNVVAFDAFVACTLTNSGYMLSYCFGCDNII